MNKRMNEIIPSGFNLYLFIFLCFYYLCFLLFVFLLFFRIFAPPRVMATNFRFFQQKRWAVLFIFCYFVVCYFVVCVLVFAICCFCDLLFFTASARVTVTFFFNFFQQKSTQAFKNIGKFAVSAFIFLKL
ncbi:hypothetical protein MsAm2_00070 [Methanolapillus ohkumae]|uniref:Uncharacterized protein n=1 Tax=Methanolapillus ohkumae TaxID=3028298 RepID=A0AA96V453_9EURY|nr:hypothetical protein MsAm2_00070 [Methanosarcinaceae archaeon Am2]